jgi:hypothetical protein
MNASATTIPSASGGGVGRSSSDTGRGRIDWL